MVFILLIAILHNLNGQVSDHSQYLQDIFFEMRLSLLKTVSVYKDVFGKFNTVVETSITGNMEYGHIFSFDNTVLATFFSGR